MKKMLFFISLLACGYLYAEENEPIEEPKVYLPLFGEHETTYNIYAICGMSIERTDSLYYIGERVVDEKTYKVFVDTRFGTESLLRVTEDNSKVYLRYFDRWGSGETTEVLMFDMSLEFGDFFTYPNSDIAFMVEFVYTDEKGRKNMLLSNDIFVGWGPKVVLKFIEGVGSSAGFFDPSGEKILLCSSKDGESTYFFYNDFVDAAVGDDRDCIAYLFDREPACNFTWADVDDSSVSDDWLVYPNPFDETFYIRHETERIEQLRVYNEAGQLLLEKEVNDFTARIDFSAPPGTYYVSILTASGKQLHQKIIRQ